jgi:hypothetical protein
MKLFKLETRSKLVVILATENFKTGYKNEDYCSDYLSLPFRQWRVVR